MAGEPANPLREALQECRIGIVLLALFSLFINVLTLTSPLYMMQVYDRVLSSGKLETLVLLTVIAALAVLVLGLLEMVRIKMLARIGQWLDRRLSPEVIRAGLRGAIHGEASNAQPLRDLTQIRACRRGPGCNTIFDGPWTPIFLTVIWLMHSILGFVGIGSAFALFILAVVNEYVSREPLKRSGAMSIANVQSTRRYAMPTPSEPWPCCPASSRGGPTATSARWPCNSPPPTATRPWSASPSSSGAGAYLVLNGRLTSGGMIAASILLGRALAPVEQAIGAWKNNGFGAGRVRSPAPSPGVLATGETGHAAAGAEGQADLRAGDLRAART